MPLANLGLVAPIDGHDLPDRQRPPDHRLRCVAGFYTDSDSADIVARTLVHRFGLRNDQVAVIHPWGLTQADFRAQASRWQAHRPRSPWRPQPGRLLAGALTGLFTGGLAAALAGAVAPVGVTGVGLWLLLGCSAGALAGAAATASMDWQRPRKRFDDAVARKLSAGQSVVVAHGLDEEQEAPVLASLQASSHSWCAEAPCLPRHADRQRHMAAA